MKFSFKTMGCILALGAMYLAPLMAKTRLIEKVEKKGNEVVIPYEKYVLDNGLTLIIHEDHSDPIVHVDVTYHVGSAREELTKSGFAHFFEHMMFQGSEHVADEQHFKIVTESGGTLNGTTNLDRTNYFETMPSNKLEVALWLEADRMGFLLDSITERKFEIQRATVKNERGQNVDNRPYGRFFEMLLSNTYPYGHPYSWPTIGWLEELDNGTVEDLKKFFLRWYGPNNAVLTVGGDVKPKEVIKLVEKYFGSIPRGPEVERMPKMPVTMEKDRYVSYEDINIRFPALAFSFPTVPAYHPDEAPLECLAEIIGRGKNSFFHKNFVKTQKAIQASVFNNNSELSGEMIFFVLPFPGQSLSGIDAEIRASIAEFEKSGVSDEAIARFRGKYESQIINGLASVSGKVSRLAHFQTFTGNPNHIQEELKRYTSVTKADVLRVYEKYLKGKPAVVLSVYPKGMAQIVAKPNNYTIDKSSNVAMIHDYEGLEYIKAKDNFDRSVLPKSGSNPVVKVPEFYRTNLPNGVKIIGTYYDELPTVTIQLSVEGGHRLEDRDPSKAGIAMLMANLLEEGTAKYSAEELASELEILGSSISVSSGDERITFTIQTLYKNLKPTLNLANEFIFNPGFRQEDFERVKKQQMESIADEENQPVAIAEKVFSRLLYGGENIMGIPLGGTQETVASITLEDVKEFYNYSMRPNLAQMVVVGMIREPELMQQLDFVRRWSSQPLKLTAERNFPEPGKTRIYLVDKEKAPQSEIRIGYMVPLQWDAFGEYYKANLMNYVLGGAFNSRINLNLREDKGYTYGARSRFDANRYEGFYIASAGVRADATAPSVVEFMKEIEQYKELGITQEELEFTKKSIGQRDALRYETPSQKAGFLRPIIQYNLGADFVQKQQSVLSGLNKNQVNELARQYLKPESAYIVVVGDKASNWDALKGLGYDIVELGKDGKVSNP